MIRAIKQAIRGCGTLPHVGSHPGTGWFALLVAVAALSGWENGLPGMAVAGGIMFMGMGAIYFTGAYGRANMSDSMTTNQPRSKADAI